MGSIHIMKVPPIYLQKAIKTIEITQKKVIEGLNITIVCEFVANSRKLLQALDHDTHDFSC